jgi:alpha-galactosidase
MKFGLHFPFAEASLKAPILHANPDWTSSQDEGYFDAKSICLSHDPVKHWVLSEALRIIDQYHVDWLLQDGENMVKRCTKRTHTHDPFDSNYANAVDGLNWITEQINAQRPNVLIENCEDGGKMMTYSMAKHYVTSIAADDSGPLTTRQAIYGVTYPFPPRYADRYLRDEELGTYITRSYMFGGPWIFMNRLLMFRQDDLDLAQSEIKVYKSIRKRIREGKVFHLTGRPAETRTDAIESYHAATDTAIIIIVRPTVSSDILIKPRGLKRAQNYRVRYQDNPSVLTMTGAQLMDQGITPQLPGMWSAEIVYIEPLAATSF